MNQSETRIAILRMLLDGGSIKKGVKQSSVRKKNDGEKHDGDVTRRNGGL